jgi:hypothetical protein
MLDKKGIEQYFVAEKKESLVFIFIGVTSVVSSLFFFFFSKMAFYRGVAIPFFLIGLLQSIVGYTVYKRSDGDRIRNIYAFDMNPGELKEKEMPRMKKVLKNFIIYRYTELLLLLNGIALYIFFIRDIKHDFWRGFGLALAVMSLLIFIGDYFAEKRARLYYRDLKYFCNKP